MPPDKVQKALKIIKELRLRRSRPRGPFLEQRRWPARRLGDALSLPSGLLRAFDL
jgi:hypothetical protein